MYKRDSSLSKDTNFPNLTRKKTCGKKKKKKKNTGKEKKKKYVQDAQEFCILLFWVI